MQNTVAEDGFSEKVRTSEHDNTTQTPIPHSLSPQPTPTEHVPSTKDQDGIDLTNGPDQPPAKRRKINGPEPSKQRAFSPPWKKIQVDGPSTFHEDGVRKSARTNFVPIDLQPQSEKRKTRGAVHSGRPPNVVSKYGGAGSIASHSETSVSPHKRNGVRRSSHHGDRRHTQGEARSDKPRREDPSQRNSKGINAQKPAKSSIKHERSASNGQATVTNHDHPPKRKVGRPRRSSLSRSLDQVARPKSSAGRNLDNADAVVVLQTRPDGTKPQRLNLRFNSAAVGVHSIGNVVRRQEIQEAGVLRPKYSSFADWLQQEASFDIEEKDKKLKRIDLRISRADIQVEAELRREILEAAEQGGPLSRDRCTYWHKQDESQEESKRIYTHQDRLLAHMHRFQSLMMQEKKRHLRTAKECAYQAAAFVQAREEKAYQEWKKDQPKTAEELAEEEAEVFRSIYIQIARDVQKKWLMVTQVVEDVRMQRWQSEQERLGKEALNEAIEKSKGLLDQRRRRSSVSGDSDEGSSNISSGSGSSGSVSEGESEDDDSNMSTSESENGSEDSLPNSGDEALTQEQLRNKYQVIDIKDVEKSPPRSLSPVPVNHAGLAEPGPTSEDGLDPIPAASPAPLEEVDAVLLDDSDEDTDMDDDMSSSDDEDESQESGSEDQESEEEDTFGALGGFFTKAQRQAIERNAMDIDLKSNHVGSREQSIDFEGTDDEADKVSLIGDVVQGPTPSASNSEEPQVHVRLEERNDSWHPETLEVQIEPQPKEVVEVPEETLVGSPRRSTTDLLDLEQELPATPVSTQALKTPVPTLLRGTLREYQHYGLDWLAGLYSADNNGILADEMGLGKTIQTISLLAHLAEHHEVWGPHLIVVPTSVMLNWEVEFKKFLPGFKVLTYYGTQEERKKKRAGWMDNDKWNVWITSYTLITQDQLIFRRKAWHYMILDEAHNIKNFQSMRWQTLLTFRTRARLLLTGTPLQNNLTELWSLLYFLMPSDNTGNGIAGFTNLEDFTGWFKKPTEQILEQGREALDEDARKAVRKLHEILRPYLLRRLKADVEKQMPGKYEHVVYCRLSKRQRYLYDGFMARAQTRETLASGNTFSIMNALMQLRKVCNHPDLFETRQIVTSFAMPKSAVADYEIKELLVRRRLLQEEPVDQVDLNLVNLMPGANERMSALDTIQTQRLGALGALRQLTNQQNKRVKWNMAFDGSSVQHTLDHFDNNARRLRFDKLHQMSYLTSLRSQRRPLYNYSLMQCIQRGRFGIEPLPRPRLPRRRDQLVDWYMSFTPTLEAMVPGLEERASRLSTTIEKFTCVTPAAVATDMVDITLGSRGIEVIQEAEALCPQDPFHESRVRQSIAFPDKRLLQYDCGKLQKLDGLLRKLQSGGHRALIFTQMTRVLDILEQFMNIHGHRYLRLDGATKLEQRQMLTERFNNDNRILAFILSSRSGGIGINLTGADTVIFYDLDWNPAMDKQCQDRCHRIGQTRDVHIYRLISEHTIEANILRKANQKRMLDDVVIQEGDFTTDFFNKTDKKSAIEDVTELEDTDEAANAAMDKVFGNRGPGKILEAVEDQDDAKAAKEAEKEIVSYDAADFDEKGASSTAQSKDHVEDEAAKTLKQQKATNDVEMTTTMEAADSGLIVPVAPETEEVVPSCDDYMIKFLDWELRDVPVQPPADKSKKKKKKGGKEIPGRRR